MSAPIPIISSCPRCGEAIWFYWPNPSLIRWAFWTDGKDTEELRLHQHVDYLRQCSVCRGYFLEKNKTLSREELSRNLSLLESILEPTADVPRVEQESKTERARGEARFPVVEGIYDAIDVLSRELTSPQELALRLHAWQAENDRVRALKFFNGHLLATTEIHFSSIAVDSLRRLFDLLSGAEEVHRFYRAEIARELGVFDVAISLFDPGNFVKLADYATQARALAEQQNRYVARLRM